MEKEVREIKTRCYYTDYVSHAIRFYLSTPETLHMEGKRKADIDNWLAVQDVWRKLRDDEKKVLETIYKTHKVGEGVRKYCSETGADTLKIWTLVTKTCSAIAKRRGLI